MIVQPSSTLAVPSIAFSDEGAIKLTTAVSATRVCNINMDSQVLNHVLVYTLLLLSLQTSLSPNIITNLRSKSRVDEFVCKRYKQIQT